MDAAYKNAMAEREYLQSLVDALRVQVADAEAKIAAVDRFLELYARFAGHSGAPAYDSIEDASRRLTAAVNQVADKVVAKPKRTRPNNPSREEVGDKVAALLEEFGRPMSRARLFIELEQGGTIIEGTDPQMVLSTMLWRMKDRFVRIPGRGYWFVDRPIPEQEEVPDGDQSEGSA